MTAPPEPTPANAQGSASEPVSTLRGAGVNYDARRVGQVAVGLCVITLAVLVIIFTIAGFHSNSQINALRHDGVPVTVTVTNCLGLMGGSGSNAAGYSCRGSFTVHGTPYTENLPGSDFYEKGATVPSTVVPNDPALVSPNRILRTEHATFNVFLLPLILLVVLVLLLELVRRRRGRRAGTPPQSAVNA